MELILIKIIASMVLVVALSLIAERLSTKWAGVLGGFPLGTALVLIFIGIEQGDLFVKQSALYAIPGVMANVTMMVLYGIIAQRFHFASPLVTSFLALLIFLLVGYPLSLIEFGLISSLLCVGIVLAAFHWVTLRLPDMKIENPVKITPKIILIRAGSAALVVLLISGFADIMGPDLSGVFASFPSTVFPFVFIIHAQYGAGPVVSIVRNFPRGLVGVTVFLVTLTTLVGTVSFGIACLLSFAASLIYLLALATHARKSATGST